MLMYFKIFSKNISFNELEVVSLGRMLVLLIHLREYVLLSDFLAAVHICNTHAFPFLTFSKTKVTPSTSSEYRENEFYGRTARTPSSFFQEDKIKPGFRLFQ